ncbi:hypothetical protein PFISCL1PPCAC_22581, partial [Pristionchus fissidentatus]
FYPSMRGRSLMLLVLLLLMLGAIASLTGVCDAEEALVPRCCCFACFNTVGAGLAHSQILSERGISRRTAVRGNSTEEQAKNRQSTHSDCSTRGARDGMKGEKTK